MRKSGVAGAIALGALLVPAWGEAATVTISAGVGPASNSYVEFSAARGERNRVTVRLRRRTLVIADHGVERLGFKELEPFGRCDRRGPRTLVCPRLPVIAHLEDGDDTFAASPGGHGRDHLRKHPLELQAHYTDTEGAIAETTMVIGGDGDDVVRGSRFDDRILPGDGKDRVDGRGGPDAITVTSDERTDHLAGGAGIDSLILYVDVPVAVDLAAGTERAAGVTDRIAGLERVHGGSHQDVLRGSDSGDALYGEWGRDRIFGRGGNDLLVGDSPEARQAYPNTIFGGDGHDVIDSRGYAQASPPSNAHLTSRIDCGGGRDRELGETDDRLARSCEGAVFRIPDAEIPEDGTPHGVSMKVWPVASDDESVTYEVPCPAIGEESNAGCTGSIALTAPPIGGEAPDVLYGSASFDLEPGEREPVRVELGTAGRQAVDSGAPIDVQVSSDLSQGAGIEPKQASFGWEQVLGPG
jgi:hypothetical protein